MSQTPDATIEKFDFCECLIHPFHNDPGVSQPQRVMDDLLSGNAKIDARKTADLLNYFFQLSRNFNYYDTSLSVSDWQPFFSNSVPFVLSSLIKYDAPNITEKFRFYKSLFDKQPTVSGLQLILYFAYYNGIKSTNDWYNKTKNNNLPLQAVMENIIKDKLQLELDNFVIYGWLASKWFDIKLINLDAFSNDGSPWKVLSGTSLNNRFNKEDLDFGNLSRNEQLQTLASQFDNLFSSFIESVKILSVVAEDSLEQSLLPLKFELQKQHHPHLALLFAFLKLFEKLQGNLNSLTKNHLDFFYREILKLKSKAAIPDSAHIILEIQKELNNHVLPKNLKVKDGKDINKQDILFSLNDEMVVNKAKIVDTRTLFLNNQVIPDPSDGSKNVVLLEGAYMAPNATMADGVDKDFQGAVKKFLYAWQ